MVAAHKTLTSEQLTMTFYTDELLRLDDGTVKPAFSVYLRTRASHLLRQDHPKP
ncbi:hypothetical protein SAMN05443244_1600 [Terriglobus roseus]|uniref:Uncharacterized protein n=1 Tax=Terriglobus roseus TaxID=392734 RepID=A0A1H4LIT1_9BACT|nr:hypothetical protein SAMN05443244_1600 [Terriglobus roseus]